MWRRSALDPLLVNFRGFSHWTCSKKTKDPLVSEGAFAGGGRCRVRALVVHRTMPMVPHEALLQRTAGIYWQRWNLGQSNVCGLAPAIPISGYFSNGFVLNVKAPAFPPGLLHSCYSTQGLPKKALSK